MEILKKAWPFLIGIVLFICVSYFVQQNLETFHILFQESNDIGRGVGMSIYVTLAILTVVIPFGTALPFMPLAVALWGWEATSLLTIIAWVIGGQLLFEVSRGLGKPAMMKFIPKPQLDMIAHMVMQKGFIHSVLVRMLVHGDIVSYGFGIFTNVSRWDFLFVTLIGVTPGALVYAYMGSLPFQYQAALALAGFLGLVAYWTAEIKNPALFRSMHNRFKL